MYQRRLIQLLVPLIVCAASCSAGFAQKCKSSGNAWTESVYYVDPDRATEFPSPNHNLLLKFAADGTMSIKEMRIHLSAGLLVPSVMVSWSPRSDAFFLNDGDGSGMTSTFRLFRIRSARVYEDRSVEKAAVSLYRRRTRCTRSALDPDVWGFGWGDGGSKIYLLVQATVHEPCGPPYAFISLVVRKSDGKILEALSEKQTQERFRFMLPASLFME